MSEFTPGVWLDGWWGWHNSYRVVQIALDHGFELGEHRGEWDRFMESEPVANCGPDRDLWDALNGDDEWLTEAATGHLQELMPEGFSLEWNTGELRMVEEYGDAFGG